jgi:hypothetical protein
MSTLCRQPSVPAVPFTKPKTPRASSFALVAGMAAQSGERVCLSWMWMWTRTRADKPRLRSLDLASGRVPCVLYSLHRWPSGRWHISGHLLLHRPLFGMVGQPSESDKTPASTPNDHLLLIVPGHPGPAASLILRGGSYTSRRVGSRNAALCL